MPKKPYPSQMAPKPTPPKRPKRIGDGSLMPKPTPMPKRIGNGSKIPKPYKGPRLENGGPSSTGPKKIGPSKPRLKAEMQPPAPLQTGIMGSTNQQRLDARNAALEMMRKNNMMRKKQG
jgi:hypothetical protein